LHGFVGRFLGVNDGCGRGQQKGRAVSRPASMLRPAQPDVSR
jgi:hypothetical protein